jgi:hypothetical protein
MDFYRERMFTPGVWFYVYGGSLYDEGIYSSLTDALDRAAALSHIHKGHLFTVYKITTENEASFKNTSIQSQ